MTYDYTKRRDADIKELLGLTMASVVRDTDNEQLVFTTTDGRTFIFWHSQDCCEYVYIESIVGDLNDLVGEPLLLVDEVSSEDTPPADKYLNESYTWTFYKFATRKGYVDVRWFGTSNGYYSETVDFAEIKA